MIAKPTVFETLVDLESERALLQSLILTPSLFDEIDMGDRDFYDEYHRKVFLALRLMHDAEIAIDPVTLKRQLVDMRSEWDAAAVGKIVGATATAAHANAYASAVRELSQRRAAVELGRELQRLASSPDQCIQDVAGYARKFAEMLETSSEKNCPRNIANVMEELAVNLSQAKTGGLPTGYPTIDATFGRMQRSELTTLGARPGGGKTTFGIEIAMHNANRDRKVLYVSLEMGELEFAKRLACIELGIDSRLMRQGNVPPDVIESVRQLAEEYVADYPFFLWAPSRANCQQISARARYVHASGGLDLLVIDHLQIVRHADSRLQRYQQLGDITAGLKSLAKELDVPVLLQSQLARTETRPTLSSLRESGDIEQNSDNVWFLHREPSSNAVEFIVAKFRHGTTGMLDGCDALCFADGGRLVDPTVPSEHDFGAT